MKAKNQKHHEQLEALKKIEGQLRGMQKMIEEGRYCVQILNQLHAVVGALLTVENKMIKRHIETCVVEALKGKDSGKREKTIDEVLYLLTRKRRGG